jgi:hypothetical protein
MNAPYHALARPQVAPGSPSGKIGTEPLQKWPHELTDKVRPVRDSFDDRVKGASQGPARTSGTAGIAGGGARSVGGSPLDAAATPHATPQGFWTFFGPEPLPAGEARGSGGKAPGNRAAGPALAVRNTDGATPTMSR